MKMFGWIVGLLLTGVVSGQTVPGWYDAGHEGRIDSLLSVMTLEEKVGQMTLFTSDWDVTGPTIREGYQDDIKTGRLGAIFNAHTAEYNRGLQRIAVEETRLGIPLLFGYDVIHGYRTIFPIPLGETASWNLEGAEESARIAARESAAAGLHWTYAPMVDVARDPRWGRVMEGAGEDVYLGMKFAAARVKGFQGDDLSDPFTLLACAKHFAAYGAAQAGRDYHTVDISERVLRDIYLPPFKAALDAGVGSFMTSFNEVDGVPATGSEHLLTDILRSEWGFMGFVVTDYTSINEMIPHGVAADEAAAGKLAVNAGVDMDMQGAVFYDHLVGQVESGEVSQGEVDEAVRRILRMKFALGLFDDPYRYSDTIREKENILTDDHRAAARRIGRESLVLLKNDNNTLPLSSDRGRILVVGELADSQEDMLGAWHGDGRATDCITLLTGMRNAIEGATIDYVANMVDAVKAARRADVIVVAAGEKWWMSGEAASRADITLPDEQEAMIAQLAATGKPVVVVLFNGRPLALPGVDSTASAILEAWYPGTEAGNAVADVLFGGHNPGGRLPMTFPRSVGQVPIFYSAKNTGRPRDANNKYTSKYLDESNDPLYPFGYGLSYTTFEYGKPSVDQSTINRNGTATVSVDVTNTGQREGTTVVQLYVQDVVGSVTRPLRELKGFERIELAAGETKTVTFALDNQSFSFYRRDMSFGSEPGEFRVYVGEDSRTTNSINLTLE
ncbi:beta-glucosidase [Lewinella aquimaris]|uniref:beta-glucosidase n=1 Tax=Neolewinella aquimaris TaxID=1835722 RepID=A0A840E8B4_9BACT|nr:glycoside hydrolase family 3 N-terminal domain-containing protein [Neolewinella aquimaris]MBB4079547.1 beta-glucosidase [Neolewinella aquimaris]